MSLKAHTYPGISEVINGNGAVAHVMKHVCGGVIGYPITPSTEIAETFEAARAEGQLNVWGKHPFFVETEGEHSAQSGALGAALTVAELEDDPHPALHRLGTVYSIVCRTHPIEPVASSQS